MMTISYSDSCLESISYYISTIEYWLCTIFMENELAISPLTLKALGFFSEYSTGGVFSTPSLRLDPVILESLAYIYYVLLNIQI